MIFQSFHSLSDLFPYFPFPFFPTCQFLHSPIPQFSCLHTLLRRAISVGPLGGRQGCHCQPQLSPPDANAAEKSAPSGIKLVLNSTPGLFPQSTFKFPKYTIVSDQVAKKRRHGVIILGCLFLIQLIKYSNTKQARHTVGINKAYTILWPNIISGTFNKTTDNNSVITILNRLF